MALKKTEEADIKSKWTLWVEISTVCSLSGLILAFYFFPNLENQIVYKSEVQEVVKIEQVEVTKQEVKPPPPPRPQVPVAVPDDQVLEDEVVFESELNQNAEVAPPPPVATEEEEAAIFEVVEEQPEPMGGISAIQSRVEYPELAKKAGIEGRVIIRAAIDEKGNVIKTQVMKSIGGGCDEAAIKAVEKTKFKPGSQRGKSVKVWIAVPIQFRLRNSN